MGRTRIKTRKAAAVVSTKEQPSLSSLLTKAQSLVSQSDYDLAQKFVRRVLERSPSHAEATELLGLIQLETGELDDARQTFASLIPPAPNAPSPTPPSAHLYLAQLSEEDPNLALTHYQEAVNLLFAQLKGKERAVDDQSPQESENEIRKNIVRVLIAMVEIWMAPTYDLCFDPKAEEMCEALLKSAFETEPGNVEALICMSSLRLSQQKPEEALECATRAWLAWKDIEDDDSPLIPPIATRIELTKRFLELSDYSSTLLVLQNIMASDDENVEAWYLEGWCFFLMAEQAKETGAKVEELTWEELARDALDCLEKSQMLHVDQQYPDEHLLEHTKELIGQLHALGIRPSEQDDDAADPGQDEDGWEDTSDADSEMEVL